MPDEIERKLIDKRVVTRYVRKGRLDEKDLEKHLKSLPDLAEQAVPIEAALDADDFDDDLDDDLDEVDEAGDAPGQGGPAQGT